MDAGVIMIVAVIGIACIVTAVVLLIRGPVTLPVEAKPFLTNHEKAFCAKLSRAVEGMGQYRVHAQVAMGAIMRTKSGLDQSTARGVRNRFDRKIVDFVIVDMNMDVVALVELDDRTHSSERDAARDAMTAAAGYVTVRMRNGYRTPVDQIATTLRPVLTAAR